MAERIKKRDEIESRYKWDLTHIYASDEAWQQDYDRISSGLADKIAAFHGRVAENPKAAVKAYFESQKEMLPIFEYAFLRKETDNADPKGQELKDKAIRMIVQAQAAGASCAGGKPAEGAGSGSGNEGL